MKRVKKWIPMTVSMVFVGLLLLFNVYAKEGNTVPSSKNFKNTVDAAKKAIKSRGLMIVATIDHKKMLSMVGFNGGGATTLEFGKPDMGKMVFSMAPEAGLEMPAKLYVYEKGGKTFISYPETNFAQYNPDFEKIDKMVGMMLHEIATEAAK